MIASSSRLRYPYRAGVAPVVQPWINPGRHALMNYRHRWPPIRLLVVLLMLLLSVFPLRRTSAAWPVIGLTMVAYLSWQIAADWLEQQPRFAAMRWQHAINTSRYLGGILGLTALMVLYPMLAGQLWMLYLVPLPTLGVNLGRRWAFTLIGLDVCFLFLSAFPHRLGIDWAVAWPQATADGLLRALLGAYIGFTAYLLVRCLAYQHDANRLAVERLLKITATTTWRDAADTIATIIADLFSAPGNRVTANVLTYASATDLLQIVGSSTQEGRALATSGFTFSSRQGVTGWAARHREPCFINNTAQDPEGRFLATTAFSGTRSALAVPVPLEEGLVAVLEVESPQTGDFAQEDLQLLTMIGSHLVSSHQRNELLEVHRQLANLSQDLTGSIIQVADIEPILKTVGNVALRLLDADIITFYYRHPDTGQIQGPCAVGDIHTPAVDGTPVNHPENLVNRVIEAREIIFFEAAQAEERLTQRRDWHDQHGITPFVVREGIVACAAIPLIVGNACIGLMWVNYRRAMLFSPPRRNLIQMIAPYAALAIQSGLQTALTERKRREKVRQIVHDSLAHRLHDIARGVDKLRVHMTGSAAWKQEFVIVQAQIERAQRVVANLVGERPWLTLQSVIDDLFTLAKQIGAIYTIPVTLHRDLAPDTPISIKGGNELMFACDEILGNITRHAAAAHIGVTVGMAGDILAITIEDDGVGFDASQVRLGQGLDNIRTRIEALAGTVDLCSKPDEGTSVYLRIPIPPTGETNYAV